MVVKNNNNKKILTILKFNSNISCQQNLLVSWGLFLYEKVVLMKTAGNKFCG